MDNYELEVVNQLTCLGSAICSQLPLDPKTDRRKGRATEALARLVAECQTQCQDKDDTDLQAGTKTSTCTHSMPRKLPIDVAETLINAVQKRELLSIYLTHAGYKNRNLTELVWKEVSDEVGRDVTFCRTTWAQPRSTFNKILAQMKNKPSGSAASKEPKWYLYHQMLFTKQHVAHGIVTGNLFMELDKTVSVNTAIPSPDSEVSLQSSTTTSWDTETELVVAVDEEEVENVVETTGDAAGDATGDAANKNREVTARPSKKKRKSEATEGDPGQRAFLDLIEIKAKEGRQEPPPPPTQEDPDLQVFKSLLPFYKQMTERNKRVFVAQTTTLCMQILDDQENL